MEGQVDEPREDKASREAEYAEKEQAEIDRQKLDKLIAKLRQGEDIQLEVPYGCCRICACGPNANEALLDAVYTEYDDGKLTQYGLWLLAKEHDRPPLGAPFDINKVPHIDIRIKLFVDGDKWCALIGEDIQEGTAGFGSTKHEALADCIANHKLLDKWFCKDCGQQTNHFWPDTFRGEIGRCNSCFFIHQAEKYPAPTLTTMKKRTSGMFEGYFIWPHKYIPRYCPYCNVEIHHIHLGSYNDHSFHENICEACQVYFGFTD